MDDASLRQRGSLTFWLNDEVIEQWVNQQKTGRRGASNTYSNTAIEFMVTIQSLFGLAGGQTEGFVESIFQLMDLDLPVPDHSTISRRLLKLNIQLIHLLSSVYYAVVEIQNPVSLVIHNLHLHLAQFDQELL